MRTIKFRGKRVDNGEWVYGDYHRRADNVHIIIAMEPDEDGKVIYALNQVIPDTVGQFTGLTDKNGKEIYEGDILIEPSIFDLPRTVFWDHRFMRFSNIYPSTCGYIALHDYRKPEIIGNIHDNPELIKQNE